MASQVPRKKRVEHEAYFRQVMENYLQYLQDGILPYWEVQNMNPIDSQQKYTSQK